MKIFAAALLSLLASSDAFSLAGNKNSRHAATALKSAVDEAVAADGSSGSATQDPLLIRAARGEKVERTPVWMMRQAGRHIQEYRDLCKKYPTFRQRSEIPEVAVEVSLQPWRNYQTDGCILFSDILTPLPGVGCEFTIDEKLGPIMEPMKNWDDLKKVRRFGILLFMLSSCVALTPIFLDETHRPFYGCSFCCRDFEDPARGSRPRDSRLGIRWLPLYPGDVHGRRKDIQRVPGNQKDGIQ